MRKILLLILLSFNTIFAQQNEIFREVKKAFDDRETAIILQYKKLYKEAPEEEKKKLEEEFSIVRYRMDEARNSGYLEALLKTKIQKDLGMIKVNQEEIYPKKSIDYTAQSQYPTGLEGLKKEITNVFYGDSLFFEGTLSTIVEFVIEKDGSIHQVNSMGENNVFNQQAEIAVYLLSKKFIPAYVKGEPVSSKHTLPIKMKFE